MKDKILDALNEIKESGEEVKDKNIKEIVEKIGEEDKQKEESKSGRQKNRIPHQVKVKRLNSMKRKSQKKARRINRRKK